MTLIKVGKRYWCGCHQWRLGQSVLEEHSSMMSFCPFCGAELIKLNESGSDIDHAQHVVPRHGYFYVPRLATPERLTVFHIVKDGEHEFLCGMAKPVGAVPPPDVPAVDRCCKECLRCLKKRS